eukprot:TRINITY_DN95634_c0_g1_i1.p1 TRINITY_DN95634_c0_g1~~TRINITY_DN95634_c0_g1_i1.p1  ORF type:complete len:175 (-),score=27.00 TRINITY_DN95634_c0_g1_i1:83-607(-)
MTLQNGDYKRAGELQPGEFVYTSEGEYEVVAKEDLAGFTPVFEITFEEDRPVYMIVHGNIIRGVLAFGSEQPVPYSPAEYIEFRFKGRMCSTMGLAETWLNQTFQGRIDGFGLRFWCSRKFAVWVPRNRCDEFWQMVAGALPQGSKLYQRPAALSFGYPSSDLSGIRTPEPLTP